MPCLAWSRHSEHHVPGAPSWPTPQRLPLSASPEMANPQRFLGSSLVAWHGLSLPISQPWHLSLMFRSRQADGVLLQAITRGRSTITLQVIQGRVARRRALAGSTGSFLLGEWGSSWICLMDHYCHLLGPMEIPFLWCQLGHRMGLVVQRAGRRAD